MSKELETKLVELRENLRAGTNVPAWAEEMLGECISLAAQQPPAGQVTEPASFTEVATLALDLTEAIWPRVKGIEQYELTNLAERCIYKGMELRKKHVSSAPPPTK